MTDWTAQQKILEDRLKELDKKLHKIEDTLEEPHTRDLEDFAQETEDTEVMESLGNAGLKEIEMINAALQRIKDGIYGECQKCGDDILPERLEVIPYTPLCRNCARKV
ncbi:MAG: TraR/DksA family transcriptional regulator [Proteobacteria bacterium]|nr:TraR/DksA family transcriptional regulator [Pseudomonadota bacterium]